MNPREEGFLLLTSRLGDPDRRVLSAAQLRALALRMRGRECGRPEREMTQQDFVELGYDRDTAERYCGLLSDREQLEYYLSRGRRMDCVPVTRVSEEYPLILRQRLGLDSPGCFWAKGDMSILNTPAVALVGSRELRAENREFAAAVGYRTAEQGLTLVSGNARGADRAAQEACLTAGGRVISIVADELSKQARRRNMLYLSEDDFDGAFSTQRALSRNRCIHALGRMVFVAQSDLGKGGTWDGTAKNLRFGWSPVACFRDGSEAARQLEQMGAYLIDTGDLQDFGGLMEDGKTFFREDLFCDKDD